MPSIIITYRRTDTEFPAGRLFDHLSNHFGAENVFWDLATLTPGANWQETIKGGIDASVVVLVLIGPDWLTATDDNGMPRLADPNDQHRREVAEALRRPTRLVIPILLNNTPMPSERDLPHDLAALTKVQAYHLSNARWRQEVGELLEKVAVPMAGACPKCSKQLARFGATCPKCGLAPGTGGSQRHLSAPGVDIERLAQKLVEWYEGMNFTAQVEKLAGGGVMVQARQAGLMRNAMGLSYSLDVSLRSDGASLLVELHSGGWTGRVGAGAVGLALSFAAGIGLPLLVTTGWGAWHQTRLPDRTFAQIRRVVDRGVQQSAVYA
jgi:hypothetical protein